MNSTHFWSWFTANEKQLRSINTLSESKKFELLYWFSQHMKYYNPQIGYRLIIPPLEYQKPAHLSFASYGDPEIRAIVLNLMEIAPKSKDWTISATLTSLANEDPDYFEKEYCLNGICCKPSDIKFWCHLIDPDTDQFVLGIILDFPIDKFDPDLLHEVVAIIITDILGEEKYEQFIEAFIIHSELPEDEELLELKELKIYLEGY